MKEIYLFDEDSQTAAGPYPVDQIKEMLNNGDITPEQPAAAAEDGPWQSVQDLLTPPAAAGRRFPAASGGPRTVSFSVDPDRVKHASMGFFRSLFDFSFSSFITPMLIKLFFGIGLAVDALLVVVLIVIGFKADTWVGMVVLILSPVILLLLVMITRINAEFAILFFRMLGFLKSIDDKTK